MQNLVSALSVQGCFPVNDDQRRYGDNICLHILKVHQGAEKCTYPYAQILGNSLLDGFHGFWECFTCL